MVYLVLVYHNIHLASYFPGNYMSKGCTCLTVTSRLWLVLVLISFLTSWRPSQKEKNVVPPRTLWA